AGFQKVNRGMLEYVIASGRQIGTKRRERESDQRQIDQRKEDEEPRKQKQDAADGAVWRIGENQRSYYEKLVDKGKNRPPEERPVKPAPAASEHSSLLL